MSEIIDLEVTSALPIRSYIWAVLKANDPVTWKESNYGGLTPLVPLSEEPELSEYSGPHIVYGYAEDNSDSPFLRRGSITFAVYDTNFRRLGKTMNIIKEALNREDETAKDINKYTSPGVSGPPKAGTQGFIGLSYSTVKVDYLEGGTPEETEGGKMSAILGCSYTYRVDYKIVTDVS